MLLSAHAKVNLVLNVTPGADAAGYHAVQTVMCAFELADDVEVELLPSGAGFSFSCEPDPLPAGVDPSANLAYRAAVTAAEEFVMPLDVSVRVRKVVPSQAGLGGGSSDAGAVLRGLAMLWGISPDDQRLVRVAAGLGADVPFFLYETPSYLTGRGDVLQERFAGFRRPAVLVKPDEGVSTGACYRLLDEMKPQAPDCTPVIEALRRGDSDAAIRGAANNMQPPARRLAPELDRVMAFLEAEPGLVAAPLLCGSGSCVAAFVASDDDARRIESAAREAGWWAQATATLA